MSLKYALLALIFMGFTGSASGQNPTARQELADLIQSTLRSEGCRSCKVWVSGDGNRTIHVLDTEATTTINDYKGRPVLYYNAGFRTVIYYSRPNVVYARHSLDTEPRPARTPEDKAAARREGCKGTEAVYGKKPQGCP
jgi:hypothetical protein